MKKTVMYVLIAVIVGLVLTLTPLIAITKTETDNQYAILPDILSGRSETLQDSHTAGTQLYIEFFVVSFTVALAAYALFKYRITHSGT